MALVKIFSGSEILAGALNAKLEAAGINTLVKNNIQSATTSGLGGLSQSQAVEVFVDKLEMPKAEPIIENFKMGL
jgi:hypothetical protein